MDLAIRHSCAGQPSVHSSTQIVAKGIAPRECINNKKACRARNLYLKLVCKIIKIVFLGCFCSKSNPEGYNIFFHLLAEFASPRVFTINIFIYFASRPVALLHVTYPKDSCHSLQMQLRWIFCFLFHAAERSGQKSA